MFDVEKYKEYQGRWGRMHTILSLLWMASMMKKLLRLLNHLMYIFA